MKFSNDSVNKLRAFYSMTPDAPIYQKEFGFYVLDKWIEQGYLKQKDSTDDYYKYLREIFEFDEPATNDIVGLGWTSAAFLPKFEEKILEDRGEHELVQDFAGRSVLYFKNRRSGFMPEYVDHPVKDMKTWQENVKWRLDFNTPNRDSLTNDQVIEAIKGAEQGNVIVQRSIGGFMFLRSLIGPTELLYKFYDEPDLIHDCMETWFNLADTTIERHQKQVSFDELFFGEDICYNHGPLISPDMIHEFLIPYYQQLYTNMLKRNLDKSKKIHFQIDTDGYCDDVIDIYKQIGCDYMSPFEVASGSDVVKTAQKHPDLLISGGIDKRILASNFDEIDRYLDTIIPYMKKRGGYIPTCDHGVPEEVSFENYMHFRKRMIEYSK